VCASSDVGSCEMLLFADAILSEAFERAEAQASLSVLSNSLLVHLGLIKVTFIVINAVNYVCLCNNHGVTVGLCVYSFPVL